MGYTNYWYQHEDFTKDEWHKIKVFYHGLILVHGGGAYLEADFEGDNPAFNFCKTNRNPYDAIVWAVLSYAKYVKGDRNMFIVSNDDGDHYGKK